MAQSALTRHWKFILSISVITAALSIAVSLLLSPLEYRAQVRLFISPTVSPSGVLYDDYTALKSAEQIGETLSNVIRTSLFQEKVIAQLQSMSHSAAQNIFPVMEEGDAYARRAQWQSHVDPLVLKGTGILTISTFHIEKEKAEILATSVATVAIQEVPNYVPGKVTVRIVDPALASPYPIRPNIPLRALFGFIFGGLFAGMYWYLKPSPRPFDFGM